MLLAIYAMFFLSGASALIYEVVWVRYLSLVFGGSHLAVASVLTVFMAGLAIGSYTIGKKTVNSRKRLRLYGVMELGIAGGALLFAFLLKYYPAVYVALAQLAPDSPLFLTVIRVIFAIMALIIPTTLMGGTLPVLVELVSHQKRTIGSRLAFLYGFNTFGAVAGASLAGFVLLKHFSVSATMSVAVAINIAIGIASIALDSKSLKLFGGNVETSDATEVETDDRTNRQDLVPQLSLKLVLWGIGISGFCALGYEVLWTRVLSVIIGASVYGFTIMLVAFLVGIASGSAAYGPVSNFIGSRGEKASVACFGLIQMLIGTAALLVSIRLIDLPVNKPLMMKYFLEQGHSMFEARQWANIVLSFSYMFIPAFFMGAAFPLAGRIHTASRDRIGTAVGEVLAYNTVGAILGSAVSGFLLIYLFGIERSLQMLIVINIGFGLLIVGSIIRNRLFNILNLGATAAVLTMLILAPDLWKIWDTKWLAVYKTNELEAYYTPEILRNLRNSTDVLYYAEGSEAIVSAVRSGDYQGFITNGRTESSNTPVDMQCVFTLGHLPMLLAKQPKKVFVLGTGAGMTLGATSVYPDVEQITLVEIEPKVIGVAKTFSRYNHDVFNNPKLKIVFNDGRNFLMSSREKFDVITADPIHPWFSGAGYLYTSEYFRLASEHLNPGGIICQWLPIYELTNDNLRSVVRTFKENFKYTMVWLTQYDIELVGSNTPIVLDEALLDKRIGITEVKRDLSMVAMGSARDFLSYFLMGDKGVRSYSSEAMLNTDDNVYLEFSAPLSVGKTSLVSENILAVSGHRESIIPYLKKAGHPDAMEKQKAYWDWNAKAAEVADRLHAVYYRNDKEFEYVTLMRKMEELYPDYAPHKIMYGDYKQTYRY